MKIGEAQGYYKIDPKKPPPIKDVLDDWVNGYKAYDAGGGFGAKESYHGYYSVDDLWQYREYDWSADKHRGEKAEWEKLVASIKKGYNPNYPIMLVVGRNGIVKIGEGNHRLAIAKQLGIKSVPVEFVFYNKAYFDRNSFQVKDDDNEEAIQALADDSPEQIKTAAKELNKEKSKGHWDDTTQELYDMIKDIMG